MYVTRKAEFSASHVCRLPELSDTENFALFGVEANPNGHGHNYILDVTLAGEPDAVTGMVIDLKLVKDVIEEEIIGPMDHRFLNFEVPPFDRIVPTPANLAAEIWRRLDTRFDALGVQLARVRLYETDDLYVEIDRDPEDAEGSREEEIAA